MLDWVLPKSDRCKKGEKLFMSARAPPSSAPPPPNEARSCSKHFLSFSLPISWGRGSQVLLGGKRFHHPAKSGMFASPGDDVKHVNEGTWWMSREPWVGAKGPEWGQWCWKGIPWRKCDWCAGWSRGSLLLFNGQPGRCTWLVAAPVVFYFFHKLKRKL